MSKGLSEDELFEECKENEEWFDRKYDSIRKEHEDKFVAVKGKEVLFSSEDIEEILRFLEDEEIDPRRVVIQPIPREGVASIL